MSESQIRKEPGLTNIAGYREKGLIKPFGRTSGSRYFYKPFQIAELSKKLGITLKSTKGLLNESQIRKEPGLTNIAEYRKKGLIKPVGRGMSVSGLSFFYKPSQIKELREKLKKK